MTSTSLITLDKLQWLPVTTMAVPSHLLFTIHDSTIVEVNCKTLLLHRTYCLKLSPDPHNTDGALISTNGVRAFEPLSLRMF